MEHTGVIKPFLQRCAPNFLEMIDIPEGRRTMTQDRYSLTLAKTRSRMLLRVVVANLIWREVWKDGQIEGSLAVMTHDLPQSAVLAAIGKSISNLMLLPDDIDAFLGSRMIRDYKYTEPEPPFPGSLSLLYN